MPQLIPEETVNIPSVDFMFRENGEFVTRSTEELFGGKKVVLFALRADGIPATDVSVIAGLNPYKTYLEQGGTMPLEEFKKKVHEYDYETQDWIMKDFIKLVTSDKTKIDMVDPPGGPYICTGMELNGKIVTGLEPKDGGYVLLMKDAE